MNESYPPHDWTAWEDYAARLVGPYASDVREFSRLLSPQKEPTRAASTILDDSGTTLFDIVWKYGGSHLLKGTWTATGWDVSYTLLLTMNGGWEDGLTTEQAAAWVSARLVEIAEFDKQEAAR